MNTKIESLGECNNPSPAGYECWTPETSRVMIQTIFETEEALQEHLKDPLFFEQAGPRKKIFFDPSTVTAGIVTCGGLCPGINDVIRALVMELHYRYGVTRILGFPFGYEGLVKQSGHRPVELHPDKVAQIMNQGGSILSSSRGNQKVEDMVDTLCLYGVKMLFTIGGDGTLRGAQAISEEVKRRKEDIAIVGIPKTIDNDINYVQKTFGFSTAFSKAVEAVNCAHTEAKGAPNGIGLVKLMGRHSGFIAVNAALASKNVNFVLIPENDFDLEGEGAFLPVLKERMNRRGHAVIIVAEGAGQKYFEDKNETDDSGNKKLNDIGVFMKEKINQYFKKEGIKTNLKYIDPSYIIRSVPANEEDSVFCGFLAQNAVHAAMCGKTNMVVGIWNNVFTYIPISIAVGERKVLKPGQSALWRALLGSTGQPNNMKAKPV
jgi:6-phosphofructokinase 1